MDTATQLTSERKKVCLIRCYINPYHSLFPSQRGKKMPEGLVSAESISNFKQTASHPVSQWKKNCKFRGIYNTAKVFSAKFPCLWACASVDTQATPHFA